MFNARLTKTNHGNFETIREKRDKGTREQGIPKRYTGDTSKSNILSEELEY